MTITILAGGVGGSKLVEGFAHAIDPAQLTIVGNIGDDLERHGLRIQPDLDIVTYTLAGIVNADTGWGIRGDTFETLAALGKLGEETWFRLGDRDIATHLMRTALAADGARPTEIALRIAARLGVRARIIPPSDSTVRTEVKTPSGWKPFQEYFVRDGCRDEVLDVAFRGAETASLTPEAREAIERAMLIVIAPSNPVASIEPILAVRGMREALAAAKAPKVAVSPLVGGKSLKGPSDRMMKALGFDADALGVARYYRGLVNALVIDAADASLAPSIDATGVTTRIAETVMKTREDKIRLAKTILALYDVPL